MNGFSAIALKIVSALALLFVSYTIGQSSLDNRVIILETNYIHIKETMDKILDKLEAR